MFEEVAGRSNCSQLLNVIILSFVLKFGSGFEVCVASEL